MRNGRLPAFPAQLDPEWDGITKREYFATAALQGLLASGEANAEGALETHAEAAEEAVKFADALLAELAKEPTP